MVHKNRGEEEEWPPGECVSADDLGALHPPPNLNTFAFARAPKLHILVYKASFFLIISSSMFQQPVPISSSFPNSIHLAFFFLSSSFGPLFLFSQPFFFRGLYTSAILCILCNSMDRIARRGRYPQNSCVECWTEF